MGCATPPVGVFVGPGVAVASGGQLPLSAAATAARTSSTVTTPSPFRSKLRQLLSGIVPKAMPTPVISSLTVTAPLPSQSPVHATAGAAHSASAAANSAPPAARFEV